jgi:uncharacterized damage-inducible protein DinB
MKPRANLIGRPYRQLARNARLANARLDRACMALLPGEWEVTRTSFFPSLKETMVHLLNADRFYIDTLRGERPGPPERPGNRDTAAEFARERAQVDDWLINFCETLTAQDLVRKITIPWPEKLSPRPLPIRFCMFSCTANTTAGKFTQCYQERVSRRPRLMNSS